MNLVDCIAEYNNILSDEMCDVMIDWFNANTELQDDGAIGTIDGDGQNDPKDFIKLINAYKIKSYDLFLVSGNRINRKDTFNKKWAMGLDP